MCVDEFYVIFGLMVRDARRRRNLTQTQLAERTGVTSSCISKIENAGGKTTLDTVLRIVEVLELNSRSDKNIVKRLVGLCGETEEPKEPNKPKERKMGTIALLKAEGWREVVELAHNEYSYDMWVELKKAVNSCEYHYKEGDWEKESIEAKETRLYFVYLQSFVGNSCNMFVDNVEEMAAVAWGSFEKSSMLTKSALLEKVYSLCESGDYEQ